MSTLTSQSIGALMAGNASLPLTRMEVSGAITGLLHRTVVCQTFINDHDVPLEAVYTHPLPPKAAVHGFRLVIGNRVVEGQVQERLAARKAYAQAISRGHRAALMEEERSDIFTTTVGNIAPGEQVSISFELSGPLEFMESTACLRFPLVVPEVYVSGDALGGDDVGDGTAPDTDRVPDASRLTPPRLPHGAANPVNLKLCFQVDPAGLEVDSVDSLCHFARTRSRDNGCYEISLLPGMERLDRDFVVRLRLKENTLQTTLVHDDATGAYALTVVPPLGQGQNRLAPRDLVIVLDRSGSMEGWSMTAARRAAARIVDSLTPLDRFAVIAFDDILELLDPHLVPADFRHQERAQLFLSKITARGGTEAAPAIERALQLLREETSSDRTVLFITDGDVANDSELLVRAASGVRVSTVGIGHNSRAGMLESMAKTSGGLCTIIPEESTLEESLHSLHLRLGRPHWMGLSISGVSTQEQAPRFWDVWEGVPTTFFGRATGLAGEVSVEGWLAASGRYSQKVAVRRRDDTVTYRSWARARLLDLDDLWTIGKADQRELIALSVEAQVLCRFTAFTAIDQSQTVQNAEAAKTVVQPVEPTLRQAAPALSEFLAEEAPSWDDDGCAMFESAAPDECYDLFGADGAEDMFDMDEDAAPYAGDAFGYPQGGLFDSSDEFSEASPKLEWEPEKAPISVSATSPPPRQSAAPSIWMRLLELLDELVNAQPQDKLVLVEQMIEALGQHCRKAAAGSRDLSDGQEVMSLLLDLQQCLQDGKDEDALTSRLRTLLAFLE